MKLGAFGKNTHVTVTYGADGGRRVTEFKTKREALEAGKKLRGAGANSYVFSKADYRKHIDPDYKSKEPGAGGAGDDYNRDSQGRFAPK